MLGMLAGEDMVKGSQFVEVGEACLGITAVQLLGEFQHVVRVTGLRAVDVVDEVLAGLLAGEVLTTAVATEGQRALARDDIPEIGAGRVIGLIAREFGNALKAHHLRHLGIGMQVVETVLPLGEGIQQPPVGEAPGHVEVLLLTRDGIGISQHLVHATVLGVEYAFHLLVRETGRQVDGPVAEAEEECLGLFVAAIHPGIAQTGIDLMDIIKRYPRTEVGLEVALLEGRPDTVAIGHTTDVAFAP